MEQKESCRKLLNSINDNTILETPRYAFNANPSTRSFQGRGPMLLNKNENAGKKSVSATKKRHQEPPSIKQVSISMSSSVDTLPEGWSIRVPHRVQHELFRIQLPKGWSIRVPHPVAILVPVSPRVSFAQTDLNQRTYTEVSHTRNSEYQKEGWWLIIEVVLA